MPRLLRVARPRVNFARAAKAQAGEQAMALLKYFQRVSDTLPSPDGPLSVSVPSSSISAANKKVKRAIEQATSSSTARKRGSYDNFTPEENARYS